MADARIYLAGGRAVWDKPQVRTYLAGGRLSWTNYAPWMSDHTHTLTMEADLTAEAAAIAPLVGQWTWPIAERLAWHTEILQPALRLPEQRIAHRAGIPAQYIEGEVVAFDKAAVAEMEAVLAHDAKAIWPVPHWGQAERHVGPLASDQTLIAIATAYADFRADEYCLIATKDHYDLIEVDTVEADSLTLAAGLTHDYPSGAWVVPVGLGYLVAEAPGKQYHSAAAYRLAWRIEDVPDVGGYTPAMEYDGMAVLPHPGYWPGDHGQGTIDPDVTIIDAGTGKFRVQSASVVNERVQSYVWHCVTKQQCWEFRQFLYHHKGRQKAFLAPTYDKDLVLSRPVGSDATSLYVEARRLARAWAKGALPGYLAFRPAGGSIIVRAIQDIEAEGADEERIDLDTAPGQAFAAGADLCWVPKCRLASDTVEIQWRHHGKCSASTPMIRIG